MQPQTRVRKMRSPKNPRRHGRSTDGIRQEYYDGDIRAAREAAERAAEEDNQIQPDENETR